MPKKWRALDPCGLIGLLLSLSIHVFCFLVVAIYLVEDSLIANGIFLLLYTPSAVLALSSLYMAWITDPGAVPMGARPLVTVRRAASGELKGISRAIRRCHKCNDNYKPNRAHHDSVTGRCIVKFDHFCPWVGNAVGALNHKMFCLFVFYTMSSCVWSIVLVVARAAKCKSPFADSAEELLENCEFWHRNWMILAVTLISLVFFSFTSCMMCEQVEAIKTNASKIARMKMKVGQAGTELSRVTEEFNEMFGGKSNQVAWHWLLPLPVNFPQGMKKVVLGYEWDETFDPSPYEEPNKGDEEAGRIEMTPRNHRVSAPEKSTSLALTDNEQAGMLTKRSNSIERVGTLSGTLT